MNFMDYCFITILILSGLAGIYQGLIRSVIGFASIFVTFFISITYYSKLASIIKFNTPIYKSLKQSIYKNVDSSVLSISGMDKLTQLNDNIINTLMDKIYVPPVLRTFIIKQVNVDVHNINTAQIIDTISAKSADILLNVMAFIILFALIQFIFTLLQNGLGTLFELPILSEVNVLGGLALGLIQGIIVLYIICAGWSLLSGSSLYREVFIDLNASKYAKWFYDNNLLLEILVKYKII